MQSGQLDITTLERVLLQVKSLPHLWVVPALTTAWTTLINYPFTKGYYLAIFFSPFISHEVASFHEVKLVWVLCSGSELTLHVLFSLATSPVDETSLASCVHSIDLLLRHCPVVVSTAPLLKHCVSLDLPALGLAIAAADQVECHDLQVCCYFYICIFFSYSAII